LRSPTTGAASSLEFQAPSTGTDATELLLGIPAPRSYHGSAATAGELLGARDLTGGVDMSTANLLTIAVDGAAPVTVDVSSADPAGTPRTAVTASQIASAINARTTAQSAAANIPGGLALRITSPSTGPSSRVAVLATGAGDAAPLLLGAAGITATGIAPTHAALDGTIEITGPVNLGDRSVIRLSVDDASPVDVDVAGATPTATLLGEIVAAIDAVLPGVASIGPSSVLRLTSPTEGPEGSVAVVPLRFLELVEYPAEQDSATSPVAHGTTFTIRNSGATSVPGRVTLTTTSGVSGPRIADPAAGWSVRVQCAVSAGNSLCIETDPGGQPVATLIEDGRPQSVPAELLDVSPVGAGNLLFLGRGLNRWSYSECRAARFDTAIFNADRFAGGTCTEEAVFDLSRFDAGAVYAASDAHPTTAAVTVAWDSHTAGALEVNLPAELDRRFGAVFGNARFGTAEPERISGIVTEPDDDPNHIVGRVNDPTGGSRLIEATPQTVPSVPIGWSAVALPFRDPVRLTGGRPDREARMYLSDPGFGPGFLELNAAQTGAYGNDIALTCRMSGPAIFDLEISLGGTPFEWARQAVLGPELPTRAEALLAPGPVGVATAKAAGVRAVVTRDRTESQPEPTAQHTEREDP
jgi:hypothetical protein